MIKEEMMVRSCGEKSKHKPLISQSVEIFFLWNVSLVYI